MIEKLLKAKFNNIFSLQAITSSKIIHYQNDFNASCNAYKQLSNDVLHNNTRPIVISLHPLEFLMTWVHCVYKKLMMDHNSCNRKRSYGHDVYNGT
jgi:hypothetical protein